MHTSLNLREGQKEGGLVDNLGEFGLLGKKRLSMPAVAPAATEVEQNREEPAH